MAKKSQTTETPVQPKTEQKTESAPAKTEQKAGGKKNNSKKVEAAPVPVPAPAPVVAAPAPEPVPVKAKGGAKKSKAEPAAAAPVVEAAPAPKKGGAKKTVNKTTIKVEATDANINKKPKRVSKKAEKVQSNDENQEGHHIRSFKVKLPGNEDFEGRFTGLTPYQAANKALSKYFRENKASNNTEITFSICESTRNSKKAVYTYFGKRNQLDVPVKYTIQDGREIVKNFKNSLRKIKKSESESASA